MSEPGKVGPSGAVEAGEPGKPVPGSTREPPPAEPSDPDSHPAPTGVDAQVEVEPVTMPKDALDGGTNIVNLPGSGSTANPPKPTTQHKEAEKAGGAPAKK
jgi:hypothetical protein